MNTGQELVQFSIEPFTFLGCQWLRLPHGLGRLLSQPGIRLFVQLTHPRRVYVPTRLIKQHNDLDFLVILQG